MRSLIPSWNCARLTIVLAACLLLPAVTLAAELKVTTWNLNWLTERPAGDPSLPADVHVRAPGDFDLLRQYAAQLDADVIAIQEVDGRAVAARIFPPDRYSIHMTHDDVVQRVGIVVRRGLTYDVNPDVAALQGDRRLHLRSGADITLHLPVGHLPAGQLPAGQLPAGTLRILAVHLKTGCDDAPLLRRATRTGAAIAGLDRSAAAGRRAIHRARRFQPPHGRQGPALGRAEPYGATGAGNGGSFKPLLGQRGVHRSHHRRRGGARMDATADVARVALPRERR